MRSIRNKPPAHIGRQLVRVLLYLTMGRHRPQWREDILPCRDDRERLAEILVRLESLVGSMPLSSPPILTLAEEADRIVNRLMGIPDSSRFGASQARSPVPEPSRAD